MSSAFLLESLIIILQSQVCQTCARAKNVCQTCLLDLEYGLPVQVRDQVLALKQDLPQNEVNREFYNQCLDEKVKESGESLYFLRVCDG